MMMDNTLQTQLFQKISAQLSPRQSLAEEVAEALSISRDSSYRRLRGETELTLSELQRLARRFNLSLDRLLGRTSGQVWFHRHQVDSPQAPQVQAGFAQLLAAFQRLDQARDREIIYFSMEMPVFQIMQVPELLAFKWYYWQTIDAAPARKSQPFLLDDMAGVQSPVIQQMLNLYIRLPSTEIVFQNALTSTAMQILFFLESGRFARPEEALVLYDKLEELVQHLKLQAQIGRKYRFGAPAPAAGPTANFQLFHNDMIPSQNTAFTRADGFASVYLEYNVLNFMRTDDPEFCDATEQSLRNIMAKSTLISSVSERERNKFFNRLQGEVLRMRKRAQAWDAEES